MTKMGICRDCKWKTFGDFTCDYPDNRTVNLVTGENYLIIPNCEDHRKRSYRCDYDWGPKTCGFEGRWFEPKED